MIKYSDNPLLKLKEVSPLFYKIYSLSILVSYFGFIVISWYFINLAYTINTPSYDILCFGCNLFSHMFNVVLLTLWAFFLYFYIVNEIRFRLAQYAEKITSEHIKKANVLYFLISLLLTVITLLYIF